VGMVDVTELNPGQVLESSVVTPNGRLLLPGGMTLTREHIAFLHKWGIARVHVQNQEGEPAALDQDLINAIESYLTPFYACNDIEEPVTRAVYEHAVKRLALKCQQGWTIPRKEPNLPVNDGNLLDSFYAGEFSLKDLVNHDVELSSFPDIYFKIHRAINSPHSTAEYLAGIISKDPSLSAKLLRIVNSPFYGLTSRVDSITRAVALVGVNELSTLALGISAISAFKDIPGELVDMRSFWTHSVAVGVLSRHLGRDFPEISGERLFVAGLLHDIGRLVMFRRLPAISTEAIIYAQSNLLPLVEAERDFLGFDHGLIGAALVKSWKLPQYLAHPLGGHHREDCLGSPMTAMVHLADFLAIAMAFSQKGSLIAPPLSPSACKTAGLTPEKLENIISGAEEEFENIVDIYFLQRGGADTKSRPWLVATVH